MRNRYFLAGALTLSLAWTPTRLHGDRPALRLSASSADGCACFAPDTSPAHAEHVLRGFSGQGPNAYSVTGRWSRTVAGSTGSAGDPVTLTYSFVPDGSIQTRDGVVENVLHATLDAQFGSRGAWRAMFERMFDDWAASAGLRFVEERSDDRAQWPDTEGRAGVRGDIRIICTPQDGPYGLLAYAYFPNSGDVVLDSDEDWASEENQYRLMRNTLMHELGHAIGLGHVYPLDESKLMEPYINTRFDGPQDDDVRGAARNYGDAYEPDDSSGTADDIGVFATGYWRGDCTLHAASDEDWITFIADAGQDVSVQAAPLGSAYEVGSSDASTSSINTLAQLPLRVELYGSDGITVLRSATAPAAGVRVATAAYRPGAGPVRLYARVSSTAGSGNLQRYALSLTSDPGAVWNVAVSANAAVQISAAPADAEGRSQRSTPAAFRYASGTAVRLTAPDSAGSTPFDRWIVNGAAQPAAQNSVEFAIGADVTAVARYGDALRVEASDDVVIPAGDAAVLTASASEGAAPYTYRWSPGTGLSAGTGESVTARPAVTTSYTVEAEDAEGRIGYAGVTVSIADTLRVSAGPDVSVLRGATVNLSATRTGGVPPFAYTWGPAGIVGDEHWHSTSLRADATTTVWVEVVDGEGDTARDEVGVRAVEPLAVDIGDRVVGSAGESVRISPEISGGESPFAYEWTDSSGNPLGSASELDVAIRDGGWVVLIVRDAIGQAASDSVSFAVGPPFEVVAAASDERVPAGSEVTLSASVAGGTGPFNYSWSPAGVVFSPSASSTGARVDEPTEFTVAVRDALGRDVTATVFVDVGGVVAGETVLAPLGSSGLCGMGALLLLPLAAGVCVRGRRR